MSIRDLRKKIEELQKAKHVGREEEEEKARREKVIAYLDECLERRRQRIADGTDTHDPAKAKAQKEAFNQWWEEHVDPRKKQREGGGGGR